MFDKLKSIFIVEDERAKKSEPAVEEKPAKQATTSESSEKEYVSPAKASKGKITQKFTDVLLRAMEANNLDGFDYLEYKQSLKSLEEMPMDEATRFKSAFAMAQTMGATPDHLIQTANHYIDILLKEEDKFGQALINQRSRQIGDKEKQIEQLQSLIKEKTQQVEQLKADIEQHNKAMSGMKNQIHDATIKVESTKNDFHASFNSLVTQIKKDITSMQNHLK
jgi:predicted RNase H-like nuclease (RuvC/YqgF family)